MVIFDKKKWKNCIIREFGPLRVLGLGNGPFRLLSKRVLDKSLTKVKIEYLYF
jgi:hypothetical protein